MSPEGKGTLIWKSPTSRPIGSRLRPTIPEACVSTGPTQKKVIEEDGAAIETYSLQCDLTKLIGQTLGVGDIESSQSTVVVRYTGPDGNVVQGLLSKSRPSFVLPPRQKFSVVMTSYLRLGIEHLISGVDHVVFVLGLFILIGWGRKLFWAVTAFTIGHSLTLGLAVLGVINFPSRLVEIAIAVTILIIALEIESTKTGALVRRSWFWPGCFGLLHGMGFASALMETGVPKGEVPLALFSFNVGIELGQLAVVAVAAIVMLIGRAVFVGFGKLPRSIPAYIIGSLAAYWIIERILIG